MGTIRATVEVYKAYCKNCLFGNYLRAKKITLCHLHPPSPPNTYPIVNENDFCSNWQHESTWWTMFDLDEIRAAQEERNRLKELLSREIRKVRFRDKRIKELNKKIKAIEKAKKK